MVRMAKVMVCAVHMRRTVGFYYLTFLAGRMFYRLHRLRVETKDVYLELAPGYISKKVNICIMKY